MSFFSSSGLSDHSDHPDQRTYHDHDPKGNMNSASMAMTLEEHSEDFFHHGADISEDRVQKHKIPLSIWALSLAFFLMNIASCIVFACAPLLMQSLGTSMKNIGILEGTVEGFALMMRSFSGFFSDAFGYRKPFISWGYGIVAFARFLLAPASLVEMVIASRWIEKLGNGLQASPREAFIGDNVHPSMLGRAYGLNKTFGMAGSFIGSFLMLFISLSYKQAFPLTAFLWISTLMTSCSFLLLFIFVKEKPQGHGQHGSPSARQSFSPLSKAQTSSLGEKIATIFHNVKRDIQEFSPLFWKTLFIISIIKFGYFSGAFLMSQLTESHVTFFGYNLHGDKALSGAVFLTIQNFACALLSYPLGKISDTLDRRLSVGIGFIFMLLSLGIFAFDHLLMPSMLYMGIILYGLQMSMQGALMALLTSTMPHHLHGTGFGLFFFSSGLSVMLTNNVFMRFHDRTTSYMTIACFILVAFFLMFFWLKDKDFSRNSLKK